MVIILSNIFLQSTLPPPPPFIIPVSITSGAVVIGLYTYFLIKHLQQDTIPKKDLESSSTVGYSVEPAATSYQRDGEKVRLGLDRDGSSFHSIIEKEIIQWFIKGLPLFEKFFKIADSQAYTDLFVSDKYSEYKELLLRNVDEDADLRESKKKIISKTIGLLCSNLELLNKSEHYILNNTWSSTEEEVIRWAAKPLVEVEKLLEGNKYPKISSQLIAIKDETNSALELRDLDSIIDTLISVLTKYSTVLTQIYKLKKF